MKSSYVAMLLIALASASGAAQTDTAAHRWPVAVGARVLVILPRSDDDERFFVVRMRSTLVGRVTGTAADTLYVQPSWAVNSLALPRSAARSLYLSRGRSRWHSAAMNALAFGGFGFALDQTAAFPYPFDSRRALTARYAVTAAALGIGAGLIWPQERWRRAR